MTLRTLAVTVIAVAGCGGEAAHHLPPDTVIDSKPDALTNKTHAVFAFHADGVASEFQCTLDGTVSACTPPFEADLVEGMHHFEVFATDRDTQDGTPAAYDWQIDTTPPDTTIVSGPVSPDNTVPELFTFTGSDGAVSFECAIDDATFAACTSPQTVTVTDGDHVFHVRALDAAGNSDPTPATQTWTLDTSTPDTAITAGPADASTSGPNVSFAFTSPVVDATFECSTDSVAFAACTSPVSTTLVDGGHTFAVRAKNAHGFVDPSPANRSWTVDAIAPPSTIDAHPTDPTNVNTPTFAFSSSDGTATFECQIDGVVAFTACTSPFTGPAISDGLHTFRVRATDPVGNQGTPATFTWTTDTVAPTATITGGPSGATNVTTPSFTFTTAGSPVATECRVDAGTFAACTSPATTTALADGPHTFEVRVTDAAGNTGNATRAFTVDTVKPVVTITSGPNNPTNATNANFTFTTTEGALSCKLDAGAFAGCTSPRNLVGLTAGSHTFTVQAVDAAGNVGSASFTWTIDLTPPTVTITSGPANPTNSTSATFTFTASDGVLACKLDAGAFAACSSPDALTGIADGSHTFTVQATDTAGNVGSASFTWTVDTVAPTVTITSGPTGPTNDSTPTFMFTTAGSPTLTQCRIDTGAFASCTSPFTSAALPDAAHTFEVRVTDAAGNSSNATRAFTVDTVAPTVTFTAGPTGPTNDPTPTFTFTTSADAVTIQCRTDAGALATCTSPFTTATLVDGPHSVTVVATDAAGNSGSASRSFSVDTTPPQLVLDQVPPAQWPVNYFDIQFHSPESGVTFTCSLNGAAFAACASPTSITTNYNTLSTFAVRAADALGNATTQTTTWTSTAGLVLHYPYEQGSTKNTSLLAQVPSLSPNGSIDPIAVVGGWAGTAAASPKQHAYKTTIRPLTSSAANAYTASVWIRPLSQPAGVIWSNASASDGITVSYEGRQVIVTVLDAGNAFTAAAVAGPGQWYNVAVVANGVGNGVELFLNGNFVGTAASTQTGFNAKQANDLVVGATANLDVDDLRFYNVAFSTAEMCSVIARGVVDANGACVANRPGYELDFEGNFADTGFFNLPVQQPKSSAFVPGSLGQAVQLLGQSGGFFISNLAASVLAQKEHSFTLWTRTSDSSPTDTLIDFTSPQCGAAAPLTCGALVTYVTTPTPHLHFSFVTSSGLTKTLDVAIANGNHTIVVTEQRNVDVTLSMTVFVDGGPGKLVQLGSGNIFSLANDRVNLPGLGGTIVDEYEFWPRDLSADPEMLCENGFDGEFDPVTQSCVLTSN